MEDVVMGLSEEDLEVSAPVKDETGEIVSEETPETGDEVTLTPSEQDAQKAEEPNLQERLDKLETANKGLIKANQAERTKRHNIEGQMQQITERINSASKEREERRELEADLESPDINDETGIKVEFDLEGNAYVPKNKLTTTTTNDKKTGEYQERIDRLEHNDLTRKMEQATATVFNKISNEQENYGKAVTLVKQQWSDLNTIFLTYLEDNSLEMPKDSDSTANVLFSKDVQSAFSKAHPTGNVDELIDVFSSPTLPTLERKLRRAAKSQAVSNGDKTDVKSDNNLKLLRKIGKQPPNMTRIQNQKAGRTDLSLEDIGNLSSEDFEKMSDKQVEDIKDLLGSS